MSKYQGSIYHGAYYGSNPKVALSAAPVIATALDYGIISISWNSPSGSFTRFRLVRNNDNFPEGEEDGVILWEQSSPTAITGTLQRVNFIDGLDNFNDTSTTNNYVIPTGQFIYYTAFIFTSGNVWVPAGYANVIMPKDHGTQVKLFSYLPKVYTSQEQSPTGISDTDSVLYNYLKAFTFTYDEILTYADLVKPSYGARAIPPQFIGINQDHLGLRAELGLPIKNQKRLIREGVYLYKTKGTPLGITGYVEALTEYSPTLTISPNLLLDTQDSSFTNSIGRWKVGAATLTAANNKVGPTGTNAVDVTWSGRMITQTRTVSYKARDTNVSTITTTVAHGYEVGDSVVITGVDSTFNGTFTITVVPSTTTFKFANTGSNVTSTSSTGTVSGSFSISLGRDTPVLKGTPVTAGTSYKFSYHAASDANGNIGGYIYWYDYLGVQIGSAVAGTPLGTTGVYQRADQTATAPTGAVYAGIRLLATTAGSYNIDMVQIAPAATATSYDEARGLDIFLDAKKVNIIANPSFETNTTGWTTNSSTTRVTDVPAGTPGTYSLKLTSQNNLTLSVTCNNTPVKYNLIPNNYYTFSMYMKSSATTPSLTMRLTATDDVSSTSVYATQSVVLQTYWQRFWVSLYIDDQLSATNAITVNFNLSGTLAGQDVYVDNAQFEKSYNPTDYFDGSLPASTGVFWSGTAHASYSYYYQGRTAKVPRLLNTLDEWVPYHSSWRVRSYKGLEGTSVY